ncbi:MAG: hypothetical protein H6Q85_56 [candidate division NC10 bacterium]|nr:hypothetical protein [candidate division NC10 bacterium]
MARVYGSLEPPLYAAVGAGLSPARVEALGCCLQQYFVTNF